MGCTLNYTDRDHAQAMKSLGHRSDLIKTDKVKQEKIRSALNQASSKRFVAILSDPKDPAYWLVSNHLSKSIQSRMTEAELKKLPEAFCAILKKQPDAMGLFEKAPLHRGPGTSAVQHHYEIFSAAALISGSYRTARGNALSIGLGDRVDFGIKFAGGYAQPKRYGTIEADILVSKGSLLNEKTVAIDAKYSETGNYGAHQKDLQRQLDGIKTGFRDGKIDEFCFVTNGEFGNKFKDMVKEENLKITLDYARLHNRLYHDEKHGIDKEYLTKEEKKNIPAGKIPENFFREYNEEVKKFAVQYEIPQIDLCQHVKFPGT